MPDGLDHFVHAVRELDAAARRYARRLVVTPDLSHGATLIFEAA